MAINHDSSSFGADDALKTLYSLYDHINLLDLNASKVTRLYTSVSAYSWEQTADFNDYTKEYSSKYIHPDDVDAYLEYSDIDHIRESFADGTRPFSMSYFRTKKDDGKYVWKAYIVMRPTIAEKGFLLSCIRDVDSGTEHILIKNDYVRLFNDLPLAYAVLQVEANSHDDIQSINVIYASNRLAKMMGVETNAMIGVNILENLSSDQSELGSILYDAAFDGVSRKMIFYSRRADKWFNMNVDKAAATGRCAIILEDVTKEHMTTEMIGREWRTDDLIINCTKLLHSGLPHVIAVDQLIKTVGEAIGAGRMYIVERISEGVFSETHEWCNVDVPSIKEQFSYIESADLLNWEAEYPGAFSLVLDDIEIIRDNHPEFYKKLKNLGVRAIIEMPIYDDGKLIGYFGAINYGNAKNIDTRELIETVSYFLSSEFSRLRLLEELEKKSIYDALCGVKNRSAMEMATKKLKKRNYSVGVLYADANGLKTVNDTQGHEAGDELLKKICSIMKRRFNRDFVYRAGGDEFVVIVPRIEKDDFISACELLKKDFDEAAGVSIAMGWNWGVMSGDIDNIMKTADKIMYEDKATYDRQNNRRRSGDR